MKLTRAQFKQAQERLNLLMNKNIDEDGRDGPQTQEVVRAFQEWAGDLKVDGVIGKNTWERLFAEEKKVPDVVHPQDDGGGVQLVILQKYFEPGSAIRLFRCVPPLRKLAVEVARAGHEFSILDSLRGKAAQERAFRQGHSKARFGQSAHNYDPPVAYDFVPWKRPTDVDWDEVKKWYPVITTHQEIAKRLGIPIRSLGDPNRDGKFDDGWDFPHIELHPWREAVKKYGSDLYMG